MPGLVAYCYWVIRGAAAINFTLVSFSDLNFHELFWLIEYYGLIKMENIMANLAINTSAWILENVGRATLMGSQEYCKSPDHTLLEYSRLYHLSITSEKVERNIEELSVVMLDWLLYQKSH